MMKIKQRKKYMGRAEAIKSSKKQMKEAEVSVKKAKKEIREAEKATGEAQEEVVGVVEVTKGKQKKNLTGAAYDLEKATYSAGESSEATEEAEFKIKESKKV